MVAVADGNSIAPQVRIMPMRATIANSTGHNFCQRDTRYDVSHRKFHLTSLQEIIVNEAMHQFDPLNANEMAASIPLEQPPHPIREKRRAGARGPNVGQL